MGHCGVGHFSVFFRKFEERSGYLGMSLRTVSTSTLRSPPRCESHGWSTGAFHSLARQGALKLCLWQTRREVEQERTDGACIRAMACGFCGSSTQLPLRLLAVVAGVFSTQK